jgi:hypothetical protein
MLHRVTSVAPPVPHVVQAAEAALADDPREQILYETALEGWQKAAADQEITAAETFALEAIVLPLYRPVFDVLNDSFQTPPPPWESLDERRLIIENAIRAIGRIEIIGHPQIPYAGTGFLVGSDLVLTNRHVAALFTQGLGLQQLRFHSGLRNVIDFRQEVLPSEPVLLDFVEPLLIHPYWDAALLRVRGIEDRAPLCLAGREPPDLDGRSVTVIGYPAFDPRQPAQLQYRIFRGIFERKRLQPGTCMGYRTTESYGRMVEALAHDCSTLGGNSGSALLDTASGQVLGLHFAGEYLKANYAVPAWQLSSDDRVVDLGIGFEDRAAVPASRPWLAVWNRIDPQDAAEPAAVAPDADAPTTLLKPRSTGVIPGDWYERVSDEDVATALRNDFDGTFALLVAALGRSHAEQAARQLLGGPAGDSGPAIDPSLPEIVYVHGILGGHLAEHTTGLRRRIWLSAGELVQGNLARRLALTEEAVPAVETDGHLRVRYSIAARGWRMAGLVVHEFSYDWRQPLNRVADSLHLFIEGLRVHRPWAHFALVAHSTGGLVACLYARRWASWSDRIQRAVLMGVPLGGSYTPVEAVLGSFPLFQKLAWIGADNDIDDLRRAAATWPGLLDCLPEPELFPDASRLYTQDGWPDGMAPPQRWLDHSHYLKPAILGSPLLECAAHLVGLGRGTIASMAYEDGVPTPGPRTAPGDGTAPARAALVAGIPCFTVDAASEDIPRDPAAIGATADLITMGTCRLGRVQPAELTAATALPEPTQPDLPEAAQTGIGERLSSGRLQYRDVAWLLAPDFNDLPEA